VVQRIELSSKRGTRCDNLVELLAQFSEFWDESYDEIEDCHLRLLKIIEVCNEIGSWNNEQILHFKRNVKSILDHNYQVLKNTSTAEVADMMKEIVNTRIK